MTLDDIANLIIASSVAITFCLGFVSGLWLF